MLYLGVDLGGTNIKAALVRRNGEIFTGDRHPHQSAPLAEVSAMTSLCFAIS